MKLLILLAAFTAGVCRAFDSNVVMTVTVSTNVTPGKVMAKIEWSTNKIDWYPMDVVLPLTNSHFPRTNWETWETNLPPINGIQYLHVIYNPTNAVNRTNGLPTSK